MINIREERRKGCMSHWIDMHSHILPGMDDGAPTDEVAINMAIAAMRDGVDAVIATPHHANGIYENEAPAIMRAVDRLNELLQQRGISLQVLPGQEIRIHDRLLDDLAQMKLMGLNRTRYLLVEFPYGHLPSASEDLFHELLVQDYVPVIAHPERNEVLSSNPDILARFIAMGALSQVTSRSLNGGFGFKAQKSAFVMCRRKLCHFVASDAHNDGSRTIGLREAYELLVRRLGTGIVEYFVQNAESLRHGREIAPPLFKVVRKRWFFLQKRRE
jgi:protein-tyrosine phosphatase